MDFFYCDNGFFAYIVASVKAFRMDGLLFFTDRD